jgi:tetratricopeptide (TPR) repeat protein
VEVIDESHSAWPPDMELRGDMTARHALDVQTLRALFTDFPRGPPIVYPDVQRSWEDVGVASGFDHKELADADDDDEGSNEDDGDVADEDDSSETWEREAAKNIYFHKRVSTAEMQPMLNKHGGSVESAFRIINERLKIDPKNPFLLVDLGNTHRILGQNKQALVHFNKASRFLKHAELYQLRGSTLMTLGRIEEASKVFGEGVENFPKEPNLRLSLGLAYAQLENWRDAIRMFRSVLRLKPEFSFAAEQLAHAQMMAQRKSSVLLDTVIFGMFALVCAVAVWWKFARKKGRHAGHKKRK